MANEQNLSEKDSGEENSNVDPVDGETAVILTRDWPEPKPEGADIMNPLEEPDYSYVFDTTFGQNFPTEEELNPEKKSAGPADTAEDPKPA